MWIIRRLAMRLLHVFCSRMVTVWELFHSPIGKIMIVLLF